MRCKLYLSNWDIPIWMHLYSYLYAARLNHISISLFMDSNFSQACQHWDERLHAGEWIKPINGSFSFDFSVVDLRFVSLYSQTTETFQRHLDEFVNFTFVLDLGFWPSDADYIKWTSTDNIQDFPMSNSITFWSLCSLFKSTEMSDC